MSKSKYKFDPESLSYKRVSNTLKLKVGNIFMYFLAGNVLGFIYFFVFYVVSTRKWLPKLSKLDFNNLFYSLLYLFIIFSGFLLLYFLFVLFKDKLLAKMKTNYDVLNKIKQENKFKHNIFIEVTDEFKFSVQNFLNSFNTYTRKAKGKIVNFQVFNADKGLICVFEAKDKNEKKQIEDWFNEYVTFVYTKVDDIIVKFENKINDNDKDFAEDLIKTIVKSFLEQCNKIALDSSKDGPIFRMLGERAGIQIEKIIIEGGTQQFSDKINNQK